MTVVSTSFVLGNPWQHIHINMPICQFVVKTLPKDAWMLLWQVGYSSYLVVMAVVPSYHYTFILFFIFSPVLMGKYGLKFATVLKLLLSQSLSFPTYQILNCWRLRYSWLGAVGRRGNQINRIFCITIASHISFHPDESILQFEQLRYLVLKQD